MGAILLALAPLIQGIFPSLKGFLNYKSKQADAQQELALARIQADKESIVSGNQSQTDQTRDKLNATSQSFKQYTFYLLVVPLVFSCIFPEKAAVLWHNFEIIPVWFRTLFGAVYCTIWGIPLATGYIGGIFSGIGGVMEARREYKLEKARINRSAVFDELRKELFSKGLDSQQVVMIDKALDKGEE